MSVTLHLGDCLEVMKSIPDKSVDAIITDIPYGTTACKWDVIIPFEPMWAETERILSGLGAFITTCTQPFTSSLIMSNVSNLRECLTWIKHRPSNFANANIRHMKYTENVAIFYGNKYFPQKQVRESERIRQAQKGKSKNWNTKSIVSYTGKENSREWSVYDADFRFPPDYLIIPHVANNASEKVIHPTQKPVALYEYLIRTYTNEGDTVLDITMGSGTTGVACVQTGRSFIGIEIDPTYYAIAERRIAEAQAQPRLEMP